jgi:NAD(P)-dependent dehydrogenase (short-subunit alcohol dehydrogenase family)
MKIKNEADIVSVPSERLGGNTVLAFARRGARAALLARGHAEAAEVQAFQTRPTAIVVDVTEAKGLAAAAHDIIQDPGHSDEPANATISVISHVGCGVDHPILAPHVPHPVVPA